MNTQSVQLKKFLDQLVADGKITAEDSQAISRDIDAIKANATKELQGQLDTLKGELAPYKAKERSEAISKFLPKNVKEEFKDDLLTLAGITDEDSDEQVQAKIKEAFDKRPHMASEVKEGDENKDKTVEDPSVGKTKTENQKTKETVQEESKVLNTAFSETL